jgi:hypothetical protein
MESGDLSCELTMGVNVVFRFLRLDKFQALTLEREVIGATYQQPSEGSYFVGSVPLQEGLIDDINTFYVRQQVDVNDSDIMISIKSENRQEAFGVPPIVNQFLKHIDCTLTFSYCVQQPVIKNVDAPC